MSENKVEDNDLPLMANCGDILVQHYIFDLFCDFEKKYFKGSVIFELGPSDPCNHCFVQNHEYSIENSDKSEFVCILDCCDIIVTEVVELDTNAQDFHKTKFLTQKYSATQSTILNFSTDKWSLRISKPGVYCACQFPQFVKISYQTVPHGKSLLWVQDQDNRPAVYTYGAWINNRSLYPCQEPPVAMATWEAHISVSVPAIVLMSGDDVPTVTTDNNVTTYYFHTKMILPLSTLALAVGFWEIADTHRYSSTNSRNIDFRICAPSSLIDVSKQVLQPYIASCLRAAEFLFGAYPFTRVDFLVVPRGFASLGMANPNIVFLSQSVLCADGSMNCRVAHEIAHTWFGLIIGASDWTEEWLSEGFATFCEDLIHANAVGYSKERKQEFCELKAYMRANTLKAEMENTDEDLQVLRPNQGNQVHEIIDDVKAVILKNGQNPSKCFIQVHYIKGYFLLKYLCEVVGEVFFIQFLNAYIQKYLGQLVDSTEMLQFFIDMFPDKCQGLSISNIVSEWLNGSEIPEFIGHLVMPRTNSIFRIANEEAKKWRRINLHSQKKKRKCPIQKMDLLMPDTLLVLLDVLLEGLKFSSTTLKLMLEHYNIKNQNADIQHKFLEIVVKHRYVAGYSMAETFMRENLAMGVYFFGEFILNGTDAQKRIAKVVFKEMREEMEPSTIQVIENMFELC